MVMVPFVSGTGSDDSINGSSGDGAGTEGAGTTDGTNVTDDTDDVDDADTVTTDGRGTTNNEINSDTNAGRNGISRTVVDSTDGTDGDGDGDVGAGTIDDAVSGDDP